MTWSALLERRWFPWVLILAWALAYLPHLGERPLRLEEGRRATPAREMLQTGDWIRPTLYGDTYLNKPPFYYWVVAVVSLPFGDVSPLTVRLPSALAALGCALVAWRFAVPILDAKTRHLAAWLVLGSSTLLDKGTLGEIDPLLCLLVAGSLKCWWDGYYTQRPWRAWSSVGVLMGMAILAKGPAGPMMFYLAVGPFLIWHRDGRKLFTLSHGLGLMLMTLPVAVWVLLLLQQPAIPNLVELWAHQLGIDSVSSDLQAPANNLHNIGSHYASFLPQLVGMFFPGVLWCLAALHWRNDFPPVNRVLRRFALCGTVFPVLVMYLYPESRPRHTMAAFFPAALLAAQLIVQWPALSARWQRSLWVIRSILVRVPLLLVGVVAVLVYPYHLVSPWSGGFAGLVCLLVGWWLLAIHRRSFTTYEPLNLAFVLALLCLLTWFLANSLIFPQFANRSAARHAQKQLVGMWSDTETIYTTRTFGGSTENYFNLQFHMSKRLRGVHDVAQFKELAPCKAIVTPEQHTQLNELGLVVEHLATIEGHGGPPTVHVVQIR